MRKYAVYSLMERNHPVKLGFAVSVRSGGGVTTISNLEAFISYAVEWHRGMARKEYDAKLAEAVKFLNSFVKKLKAQPTANPSQQLANKPLKALGKYILQYENVTGKKAIDIVDELVDAMIALGDVGSHPALETFEQLSGVMQGK